VATDEHLIKWQQQQQQQQEAEQGAAAMVAGAGAIPRGATVAVQANSSRHRHSGAADVAQYDERRRFEDNWRRI